MKFDAIASKLSIQINLSAGWLLDVLNDRTRYRFIWLTRLFYTAHTHTHTDTMAQPKDMCPEINLRNVIVNCALFSLFFCTVWDWVHTNTVLHSFIVFFYCFFFSSSTILFSGTSATDTMRQQFFADWLFRLIAFCRNDKDKLHCNYVVKWDRRNKINRAKNVRTQNERSRFARTVWSKK